MTSFTWASCNVVTNNPKLLIFAPIVGLIIMILAAPFLVWNFKSSHRILSTAQAFAKASNHTFKLEPSLQIPPSHRRDLPFSVITNEGIEMSYTDHKFGEISAYVAAPKWSDVLLIYNPQIGIRASAREFIVSDQSLSVSGILSNPKELSHACQRLLGNILKREPQFFDKFTLTGAINFIIVKSPRLAPTDIDSWTQLSKASRIVRESL